MPGRAEVRSRSMAIITPFGGDRILYAPDSRGVNYVDDGVGIDKEEAYVRKVCGLPSPWDQEIPEDQLWDKHWFIDTLG